VGMGSCYGYLWESLRLLLETPILETYLFCNKATFSNTSIFSNKAIFSDISIFSYGYHGYRGSRRLFLVTPIFSDIYIYMVTEDTRGPGCHGNQAYF
jgi:hypothetical protein